MEKEYSVFSGKEEVGKVWVQRRGLYYRICCRCALTGTVPYKLIASCGDNTADLGLCVPQREGFGVDTGIPIKRLGEGPLTFRLIPRRKKSEGRFAPISPEEPFHHIAQLQNAVLAKRDGVVGILVPEGQNSSDSPTGQWSEPITSE